MKLWDKDIKKLANHEDMVTPLVKALKFAYKLTRINRGKDIPYDGYDSSVLVKVGCPDPDYRLRAESLDKDREQGRSPADTIMSVAIQVGMEQGRRMTLERVSTLNIFLAAAEMRINHGSKEDAVEALKHAQEYLERIMRT